MRESPAFPIFDSAGNDAHKGLTKREYFAALAMQALVQSTQEMIHITPKLIAEESCVYADALIAELEK